MCREGAGAESTVEVTLMEVFSKQGARSYYIKYNTFINQAQEILVFFLCYEEMASTSLIHNFVINTKK